MKYTVLSIALLFSATTSASAGAFLGTCYFEANNKVIIDGKCDVFFEEDTGSFTVYSREVEAGSKEYGVALFVKSARTGEVVIKEVSRKDAVEQSLGILTLNDRCWANADIKLCTWNPYE